MTADHATEPSPTTPVVSILLSTHNGAAYVDELIESLLTQTHQDWQLLARDDGSVDDTPDRLARWAGVDSRIVVVDDPCRRGVVGSFLHLLERADGDVFAFCDQDDVWFPHKLAWGLERLRTVDDTVAAVAFDAVVVDAVRRTLAPSALRQRRILGAQTPGEVLLMNPAIGATLMGTRHLGQALVSQGTDIDVPMHDWWCAAVAACTGTLIVDPVPVIEWRRHGATVTGARPRGVVGRVQRRSAYVTASSTLAQRVLDLELDVRPDARAAVQRLAALPEAPRPSDILRLSRAGARVRPWYRQGALIGSTVSNRWTRTPRTVTGSGRRFSSESTPLRGKG